MRLWSEVRERVRALLFRRREERELSDELAFHIEQEAEENLRRGLAPGEARRRALITLGGIARIEEEVRDERGTRLLEDLARDIRFAVRRLAREPGFTVPAMATIALGIGVVTAVFALVNAVLLRPLPYPDAGRLVEVRHAATGTELAVTGLSAGTMLHYRTHARSLEDIGYYLDHVRTLTDVEAPEQVRVALASPSLFSVLRIKPHLGALPAAADFDFGDGGGVLISHDLWVRRYGADPDIVGRTIEMERRHAVVVGVAQEAFHFPLPETHVWIPWPAEEFFARYGGPRADVHGLYMSGVARLRPGVSRADAERDLDALVRTLPDAYPDVTSEQLEEMGLHAVVAPLKDVFVGDVRAALLLLLGTAAFLLLITWANVTNLTLVRSERLRREVALQRVLGATSGRLARRFVSESSLLAIAGGLIGVFLAGVAVDLRFGFATDQIPRLRDIALDGTALGVALGLVVLTIVLLAAVAARSTRMTSAATPLTAGFGRMTAGPREQRQRRLLVTAQLALACTLLVGSALMARSYAQLRKVELGFSPNRALTFLLAVPSDPYLDYKATSGLHHELLDRLRAIPGVAAAEAATVSTFPLTPVRDYHMSRVAVVGRPAGDSAATPYAAFGYATPGYFRAMGIPLLEGRAFDEADAVVATPDVILSAALARDLFGAESAIGRQVRVTGTGGDYHVRGMVGDVPSESLREGPASVVYFPHLHPARASADEAAVPPINPREEQYVVRTTLAPTSLVAAVRRSIQAIDSKLVMMRPGTLDELVARSRAQARLTMLLLIVGSVTALFLGLIGIYGVLSYTVRRRTSELGVRIALGASPDRVVRMVLRQGVVLAVAGIASGLAAALALSRFLRGMLFEVSPSDPLAFAGVAVALFAVAMAASWLPALRAGRIDPVRALRAE